MHWTERRDTYSLISDSQTYSLRVRLTLMEYISNQWVPAWIIIDAWVSFAINACNLLYVIYVCFSQGIKVLLQFSVDWLPEERKWSEVRFCNQSPRLDHFHCYLYEWLNQLTVIYSLFYFFSYHYRILRLFINHTQKHYIYYLLYILSLLEAAMTESEVTPACSIQKPVSRTLM